MICCGYQYQSQSIGYLEHLDRMGDNNLCPEIPQREKHFTSLPLLAHLYLAVQVVNDVLTLLVVISLIKGRVTLCMKKTYSVTPGGRLLCLVMFVCSIFCCRYIGL